jgi:hypothetical protein
MAPGFKKDHFFRFITLDVLISFDLFDLINFLLIEPLFYFLIIRPILQEFLSVD